MTIAMHHKDLVACQYKDKADVLKHLQQHTVTNVCEIVDDIKREAFR